MAGFQNTIEFSFPSSRTSKVVINSWVRKGTKRERERERERERVRESVRKREREKEIDGER